MLKIKRIYDEPTKDDGYRILVDRMWPRGVKKTAASIDLWLKEIAPSTELRKWFGHDPKKWQEFRNKYFAELKTKSELIAAVLAKTKKQKVTLLYAAKDTKHNNAIVLLDFLQHQLH
jgi:uncharacterized protein YeaO (DUF488 family)